MPLSSFCAVIYSSHENKIADNETLLSHSRGCLGIPHSGQFALLTQRSVTSCHVRSSSSLDISASKLTGIFMPDQKLSSVSPELGLFFFLFSSLALLEGPARAVVGSSVLFNALWGNYMVASNSVVHAFKE